MFTREQRELIYYQIVARKQYFEKALELEMGKRGYSKRAKEIIETIVELADILEILLDKI